MTFVRGIPGFAYLVRALILALGLGFAVTLPAVGAPLAAASGAGLCVIGAGDCLASPAQEPREHDDGLIAIVAAAIECVEAAADGEALTSTAIYRVRPSIAPSPFGEARELRHVRGSETLPDKTGPPRA
ncbi:MAG: hypothetical protein ACK4NA_00675 [Alphaproteobacteria bacterium]